MLQAAAREAEAARVEMSAIVERSTHEANECREQVLCVQQVNEELQVDRLWAHGLFRHVDCR